MVLVALTLVTGVAYPAAVTAVAQLVFPGQANGSMITANGSTVGSALIGQAFSDPGYFWGRPSAAGDGYDGMASAGSNLGPTSRDLIDRVTADVDRLRAANGDGPVPVDLVTTSGVRPGPAHQPGGGGLPGRARGRGPRHGRRRRAGRRGPPHARQPLLVFLGEPRVNVLELNLDLDGLLR